MMEHIPEKKYPVNAKDYKLYEEVGDGVSASVYRALCIPFNEIVAIKVLDLEKCNNDLDGIRREVQTMSLIAHANLLKAHCSFTTGHHLWLVMPYMAGGSCLHIMKSSYSEGFEEPVIATLLRETLCALGYLHKQGHIHRDVKAGNILLDSNGTIKLADFGVSACMFDTGDRQRSRNTFVGTPCWMAPEVMQQLHGYDFRADIWSFGITALELAHGHAPFSKYPPMKVLLMTLQNAPPGLDYERDKRFSKSFKDLVAACLVKDPKKRPTSEKLLKHSFFKHAESPDYLRRTILEGLPPLGERFKMLKAREAELLQNKDVYGDKEQLSQQEYIRGISAWNFNLEDLKNQAASIQDDDSISGSEKPDASRKLKQKYDYVSVYRDRQSPTNAHNAASELEDEFDDVENLEGSLASFPIQPLQALKGYFDVGEDDSNGKSPSWKLSSDTEMQSPSNEEKRRTGRTLGDNLSSYAQPQHAVSELKNVSSGPLLPENVNTSEKHMGNGERELHARYPADKYYSGNLQYHHRRGINNNTSAEDESEEVVFRHKGRFKVTSANLSPKISTSNVGPFSGSTGQYLSIPSILPTLQCILQQNNMQREELIKLIKLIEESSGNLIEAADSATNDLSQMSPASAREGELMALLVQLEQRVGSLVEELQNLKLKNAQLELQVQLSVIGEKEERAA